MLSQVWGRFGIARTFFSRERDFPIAPADVLSSGVFKAPCTVLGPRRIDSIEVADDFYRIRIQSVRTPLLWPKSLPLFDLYKVVTECFYDDDWHFYEVPETRVASGDVVLDCGAAEGIFSLRVLERAGHIALLEPLPIFGHSLRATFAAHHHVSVVSKALGSLPGQAYLAGGSLS